MISSIIKALKATIDFLVTLYKDQKMGAIAIIIICTLITISINTLSVTYTHTYIQSSLQSFTDSTECRVAKALRDFKNEEDSLRREAEYKSISQQIQVRSYLDGLINRLRCEYIMICQFHNNVESISGCQFIKFDVTFNAYKEDLSTRIDITDYQNIPITEYKLVGTIWDSRTNIFDVPDLQSIDKKFYDLMIKHAPTVDVVVFDHITIDSNRDGVIIYMFNDSALVNTFQLNRYTDNIGVMLSDKPTPSSNKDK